MTDFLLDPSTGDLDVSSGGFEIVGDGADGVAQEATIRSKQVQGDWYLDLEEGLPYFSRILVNGPNFADVYQIYAAEYLDTTGVLKIEKLELTTPVPNSLTVEAQLLTVDGVVTINTTVP